MTIIVVGAGIVGCAIAHELACRGADVDVVDPRGPGRGATRASAGILAPTIDGHSPALEALAQRSLSLYDGFIAQLRAGTTLPVEYERNGTLRVALTTAEADGLAAAARDLEAKGVTHSLLDGDQSRTIEPWLSESIRAGLLVPEHGYVSPSGLTAALADAALRRGVSFTTAAATRICGRQNAGVVLETTHGTMTADALIVASGSWSAGLVAPTMTPAPVRPVRGQLLHLGMPERGLTRPIWGERGYLVPWRDGTVLVGATVEDVGFDETTTAGAVEELIGVAADLVPALRSARFVEARAGLRPKTDDELPVLGPSSTMANVFYATGHYRNGVILTPLTTRVIADLVLEGKEDEALAVTRPSRFGL